MGEEMPQPSMVLKSSRALRSMNVGATRLTLMRRPVRLVGSAKEAMSFGSGTSGSGRCAVSNFTTGPSPAGVARRPSGAVSMPQAAPSATIPKAEMRKERRFFARNMMRTCLPPDTGGRGSLHVSSRSEEEAGAG